MKSVLPSIMNFVKHTQCVTSRVFLRFWDIRVRIRSIYKLETAWMNWKGSLRWYQSRKWKEDFNEKRERMKDGGKKRKRVDDLAHHVQQCHHCCIAVISQGRGVFDKYKGLTISSFLRLVRFLLSELRNTRGVDIPREKG